MRPVRPSEIASVIAENLHGARLAPWLSRIKDELRAAFRPGGGFRAGGIRFLFPALHMTARLERKWGKGRARETSTTPALTLSKAGALHLAMESQRMKTPGGSNATEQRITTPPKTLMLGTSP